MRMVVHGLRLIRLWKDEPASGVINDETAAGWSGSHCGGGPPCWSYTYCFALSVLMLLQAVVFVVLMLLLTEEAETGSRLAVSMMGLRLVSKCSLHGCFSLRESSARAARSTDCAARGGLPTLLVEGYCCACDARPPVWRRTRVLVH